jgi:hypothetical protein
MGFLSYRSFCWYENEFSITQKTAPGGTASFISKVGGLFSQRRPKLSIYIPSVRKCKGKGNWGSGSVWICPFCLMGQDRMVCVLSGC